jgi:surfactin synthase thioesterase subunit
LLYELTRPVPPGERVCSYVCVPYGGGSAVVYQPVADRMPAGHSLYSVAIPGHDVGLDESALPFGELARRCVEEILQRVQGPLVLYGHCGVGGALVIELARRLEEAGRPIEAVYAGGVFPFARPRGALPRLRTWAQDLGSNRHQAAWLKSMGVDMDEMDPAQANRIISNMRRDGKNAEEHLTRLLGAPPAQLRAPVISVVGERDPVTDYYQERYREWRFIARTAALVVLAEAGHFFLRHRADDLVQIITRTHRLIRADRTAEAGAAPAPSGNGAAPPAARRSWQLLDVARGLEPADPVMPADRSMRRFGLVALGQLASITGSSLTGWAIPVWLYMTTRSLLWFGLSGASAVIPILLGTPLAGAVADRFDRRRVIMAAACLAAAVELAFAAALWAGHHLALALVYVLVWLISFAGTFQRVAFTASIPQLAPKRYLGHANGIAQLINGLALLFVPLMAAGLLAAIGLRGILLIDIGSYAFAIGVLAATQGDLRRADAWRGPDGGPDPRLPGHADLLRHRQPALLGAGAAHRPAGAVVRRCRAGRQGRVRGGPRRAGRRRRDGPLGRPAPAPHGGEHRGHRGVGPVRHADRAAAQPGGGAGRRVRQRGGPGPG